MSGVIRWAITEQAVLRCQKCPERWRSAPYAANDWVAVDNAPRPAFEAGWRVFIGARTQHTYCPQHGPGAPMRQAYPREGQPS